MAAAREKRANNKIKREKQKAKHAAAKALLVEAAEATKKKEAAAAADRFSDKRSLAEEEENQMSLSSKGIGLSMVVASMVLCGLGWCGKAITTCLQNESRATNIPYYVVL